MTETHRAISELEEYFLSSGLRLKECTQDDATFGNKIIIYEDDEIITRIVCDRGIYSVDFSRKNSMTPTWYDVPIIMIYISGVKTDIESINIQVDFVKENWDKIIRLFSKSDALNSMREMDMLKISRARRLFPSLFQ